MDAKLRALAAVPLFAGLGGHQLEAVGRLADEIDLPEGSELTRQGKSAHEFFVLLDGTVRVERDGKAVRHLGAGDFLGEIALVDGGPRTATVVAATPVRALVIGHREFNTLLEDYPEISRIVLRALANRVRNIAPDHE